MSETYVVQLAMQLMWTAALLSAPIFAYRFAGGFGPSPFSKGSPVSKTRPCPLSPR